MKPVCCDGSCEEHRGPVQQVHVVNPTTGTDWGIFNYCQTAIEEDTKRGLIVTPVKE